MIDRLKMQGWWIGAVAGSVALFAVLLLIFVDLSASEFFRVLLAAILASSGVTVFVNRMAASRRRGGSPTELINRLAAGDLTAQRAEIEGSIANPRMAAALRGLTLSLERTISRFTQLVDDVNNASNQVGLRARSLGESAAKQVDSVASTTAAITDIDRSIGAVQKSMENLSLNAEETSTSVLQMSASIEEVGRISDTLFEFVEQTASAIEEMIASINEVAQNTESFSSFTVQTASAIVQMNATTVEIGKSARQSSDFSRYVTEAANEGREAARTSADGMRKIHEAVDEAKLALNMLGERSQEIGEIVRVIDEIAGQTNLLALNAAIIAAQAGDRGKGFAVVADEIRDLSERTSASTEEIRTLIQNVQKGVNRAVEQMTISADRVNEGVSLTARAEQVLDKILDLTNRSNQSILEIAKATEEQTRGSQSATNAIEEITKMVQQTATAAQEQSLTSTKIGEQASAVRDYTKHLRRALEEQQGGSRAISQAMENIMSAVATVFDSMSVLASKSSSIVTEMAVVRTTARDSSFAVADLGHMASSLRHESSLLNQELRRFRMPELQTGGIVRTATVLPNKLTLDPVQSQFLALSYPQKSIHETLVQYGEGAELIPGIAERWEILEHGALYRFHVRHNVRFHNGRLLTAKDAHDSFLRILNPALNSSGKWIMRMVKGANEVLEGRSRTAQGLRVIDDFTLEIELEEPIAFFILLMSLPEMAVIAPEETRDAERFRLHPIGAGPFQVEEVVEGQRIRLVRNRNYYMQNRPLVDGVEFRLDLKSTREVTDAFIRGELNIAHGVPLARVQELRQDPAYAPYLLDTIQLHTSYLTWDNSTPPFNNADVRRAVNYAINRQRINEKVFSGLGALAGGLLPPGLVGYDPKASWYPYDPDRARTLLRNAGFSGGIRTEYWTWDTDDFNNLGQIPLIIEDLAAVGIEVKVVSKSAAEVRAHRDRPGHNTIFAGNWYADFPDSDNFFYIFFHTSSDAIEGMNFRNAELDAEIELGRKTTDLERRAEIYTALGRKIHDEAPLVCLFHERFYVMFRPEIRGLRTYLVPPPVRYRDVWMER
jgi:methyl-accepting chemotaxis protein/ABC-type transport system substrate-binding protein